MYLLVDAEEGCRWATRAAPAELAAHVWVLLSIIVPGAEQEVVYAVAKLSREVKEAKWLLGLEASHVGGVV